MKKYIASVRDKETRKLMIIEREYDRKSDFYNDLRGNGYSVRFIATEETFDAECDKWYAKNEASKLYHKAKHLTYKEMADEYGISVAHYIRAWKAYCKAFEDNTRIVYLTLEDFIEIYK